jgi:hypothetical protein
MLALAAMHPQLLLTPARQATLVPQVGKFACIYRFDPKVARTRLDRLK